jgi:glycosyltransferase involved in cell wall biosynthesis
MICVRVAILTSGFFPVIDGVTVTVWNRVRRLSQYGHQVLLFCPDYSPIADVYPNWQNYVGTFLPNITVVSLPSEPFMGLKFERNVKKSSYSIVLEKLKQFQPDLIHVDEPERLQLGFDRIPAVDFAQQYQIPCISFLHTNFIEYLEDYFTLPGFVILLMQRVSKRIVSRIYNAYDATLVSSQITAQQAQKMGIKNLIEVELLGVNLQDFRPELKSADFFARTYEIPHLDQKVKLTFLSRLTPDKGWKFAINAFSQMAKDARYRPLLDRVALIIAGDGSMRSEITTKLAALTSVYCLGRVDPATVPALLLNSDIHVTASEKETKGLTILEAFAAGIPVIAPRAGGVIDSVQSGENGFLFQPQNWQDFAATLERLVNDAELRQHMGMMARQTATNYDWNAAVDRLLHIWQTQIDRKAGR